MDMLALTLSANHAINYDGIILAVGPVVVIADGLAPSGL